MRRFIRLALAASAIMPVPALAQSASSDSVADQIAAMQAEIARLSAEVAELRRGIGVR